MCVSTLYNNYKLSSSTRIKDSNRLNDMSSSIINYNVLIWFIQIYFNYKYNLFKRFVNCDIQRVYIYYTLTKCKYLLMKISKSSILVNSNKCSCNKII